MELFLIIVACVLVWMVVTTVKDMDAKAEERSNELIMATYLKVEGERYHRERLAAIDATVQATIDQMEYIAAEVQGDVIEGTAVEVRR
jgi:hypothetical protein